MIGKFCFRPDLTGLASAREHVWCPTGSKGEPLERGLERESTDVLAPPAMCRSRGQGGDGSDPSNPGDDDVRDDAHQDRDCHPDRGSRSAHGTLTLPESMKEVTARRLTAKFLKHSLIAIREQCSERSVRMTLSLAFLSPAIVQAIVDGRLPRGIGIKHLAELPSSWSDQHQGLGLDPDEEIRRAG